MTKSVTYHLNDHRTSDMVERSSQTSFRSFDSDRSNSIKLWIQRERSKMNFFTIFDHFNLFLTKELKLSWGVNGFRTSFSRGY